MGRQGGHLDAPEAGPPDQKALHRGKVTRGGAVVQPRRAPTPILASCRLLHCAACRELLPICSRCERGQIYCAACAPLRRASSRRRARERYARSPRGRRMHAVSSAGDVDGDGLDDLVASAPYEGTAGAYAGSVYLLLAGGSLSGASGSLRLSGSDVQITGESVGDNAGWSVSSAGDVDGDGAADLLVGAFLEDTTGDRAGAAYLLRGGSSLAGASGVLGLEDADLKLTAEDASDYAGFSVSSAGDVDGDGLDDALVGAPQESEHDWTGAAYLLLGGGSLADAAGEHGLEEADLKLTGEEDDDLAGSSVSSAGDVDGDGLDDLLIGADGVGADDDEFGAAYLVRGRSFTEGY